MGIIREALDNLVVSESCKDGKCKKHLKEWVTPPCSLNWKELKSLADVEAWAKEVEEKTGKTPNWALTDPKYDEHSRELYYGHYINGDRVFIGGTSGLYGADDVYFLGVAEPGKDGKLTLIYAFDAEDRPVDTVLVDKEQFKDKEAIKEGYFDNDRSDDLWESINSQVYDCIEALGYQVEDDDLDLVNSITDDAYSAVLDSIYGIVKEIVEARLDEFEVNLSSDERLPWEDEVEIDDLGPWGRK